jgi:P-type Cu+ transporter
MAIPVVDPVCRMEIDPSDAAAKREYQGKVYYFCADNCARQFDQQPDRYVTQNRREAG